MTSTEIKKYLYDNVDPKYREFHQRLVPTVGNLMGVRMPVLKKLAKDIAKGDWQEYLRSGSIDTYEEVMVRGLVIGNIKTEFDEFKAHIASFVPLIDNWAVCDCVCANLKQTKKYKSLMWNFINGYLQSDKEFDLRFAVIMMMDYYLDDHDYIDNVLNAYDNISYGHYYVKMGVAWGISQAFIKYPDRTLVYLRDDNLDAWTHNKAIQKITESFRVTPEDKAMLRGLKR